MKLSHRLVLLLLTAFLLGACANRTGTPSTTSMVAVSSTSQQTTIAAAPTISSSSSPSTANETQVVDLPEARIVLTYPSGWHLAEQSLTPNLANPREVFSLGSFPLKPAGPSCAQIPSQALHDMEATDVFVTVQERGSDAIPAGFDPRPESFGPTPGSTDNVFYDCIEPAEQGDIGDIHWIGFADHDRYFHVAVAIGSEARPDRVAAVWNVLDDLVIQPKD